jgi:hypothetical protein
MEPGGPAEVTCYTACRPRPQGLPFMSRAAGPERACGETMHRSALGLSPAALAAGWQAAKGTGGGGLEPGVRETREVSVPPRGTRLAGVLCARVFRSPPKTSEGCFSFPLNKKENETKAQRG